ncbi:Putative peptidoglycan binding domain-containing protein [Agrobacterium fabrum]|uniref:Peptidoglycan binding domain-containing protein n=1 Tax=Agrobacterium fabrum TaxID=1176649 RepID=A0A7Z7FM32_9HYPH|nr:peptidoglycan-binding protein [Agrobacterium fabrum]SDJ19164.1 Putative peptidoglycan binding domain-containing protein [Agrobacterium fabrum]
MVSTLDIQQRLILLGYDVGPTGADGIPGRSTTKAVTRFQEDKKLSILCPGTIGPKTLTALGLNENKPMVPPWVTEARRFIGLHESKNAKVLDKALRLDASEIAWCGAFVAWRDNVWVYAYRQLAKVQGGQRSQPTIEQFLAEIAPIA